MRPVVLPGTWPRTQGPRDGPREIAPTGVTAFIGYREFCPLQTGAVLAMRAFGIYNPGTGMPASRTGSGSVAGAYPNEQQGSEVEQSGHESVTQAEPPADEEGER